MHRHWSPQELQRHGKWGELLTDHVSSGFMAVPTLSMATSVAGGDIAKDEASFHSLSDDSLTTELCTQTTEAFTPPPPGLRQCH
jgi:hypothetical protein